MKSRPAAALRRLARHLLLLVGLLAIGLVAALAHRSPNAQAQPEDWTRLHLPIGLRLAPAMALATPIVVEPPTASPAPTLTLAPTAEPSSQPTPSPSAAPSPTPGAETCAAIPSFEDGLEPTRELHVATDGDDASGDGSPARPFRSLERAVRSAEPGTAIRLQPGTYAGGSYIEDLRGTQVAPIWIGGLPGQPRPIIEGGGNAIHLVRAAWLILHDLETRGSSANGINADDGGDTADAQAAHHLVFRKLDIRDVGGSGNQDCLKLSGPSEVLVVDSTFARCGGGGSGSGIDMVGVHRALIAQNRFAQMSGNAIQAKGGSQDIEIRWNRMTDAGHRAVNMGGSTGFAYFRPPLDPEDENAEARDIRVLANVIEGGDTPWAFVGCVDCLAAHNTVVEPRAWLMRILQETSSRDGFSFAPAREGRVLNNVFVFRRDQLRTDVNVGGGTAPETFHFEHNLWYASDSPGRSAPNLPVPERRGISGQDPLLRADRSIPLESPAAGAGLPSAQPPGDIAGRCYSNPPSIGAFEASDR